MSAITRQNVNIQKEISDLDLEVKELRDCREVLVQELKEEEEYQDQTK